MSVKISPVKGFSLGDLKRKKIKYAEKIKFNNFVQKTAKSIYKPKAKTEFCVNTSYLLEQSVEDTILGYKGQLDLTNSQWAPWASYSKVTTSINSRIK